MSMPTWLRLVYIKQINKAVQEENERNKKASKSSSSKGISKPSFASKGSK